MLRLKYYRSFSLYAMALLVLGVSMGASCTPRAGMPFSLGGVQAPTVLTATSTTAEIVAAVNANTARVQTYQANKASFTMPGMAGLPLLSGSIAAERPHRFRMRAVTTLTGPEVDLGSNEERFWVWARRNEPAGVFTARHDQFAASPARQQLPVDPLWLVEALGLPTLDPSATFQGPFPHGNGTIEIRSQLSTPTGLVTRVYMIDNRSAEVREQHLYDASGTLTASAIAKRFYYDAISGASLPEEVEIRVPAAQLTLRIHTGPIVVNAPLIDNGQLWQMPQINGFPVVDIAGGAPVAGNGSAAVWDLAGSVATSPWKSATAIHTDFGSPANAPLQQPLSQPVRTTVSSSPSTTMGRIPATGVAL